MRTAKQVFHDPQRSAEDAMYESLACCFGITEKNIVRIFSQDVSSKTYFCTLSILAWYRGILVTFNATPKLSPTLINWVYPAASKFGTNMYGATLRALDAWRAKILIHPVSQEAVDSACELADRFIKKIPGVNNADC